MDSTVLSLVLFGWTGNNFIHQLQSQAVSIKESYPTGRSTRGSNSEMSLWEKVLWQHRRYKNNNSLSSSKANEVDHVACRVISGIHWTLFVPLRAEEVCTFVGEHWEDFLDLSSPSVLRHESVQGHCCSLDPKYLTLDCFLDELSQRRTAETKGVVWSSWGQAAARVRFKPLLVSWRRRILESQGMTARFWLKLDVPEKTPKVVDQPKTKI